MTKVSVFLPLRKGSERVRHKNIRPFAGIEGGLTSIKIRQLLNVKAFNKIIVSTNDLEVKRIADSFSDRRIVIDDRPERLAQSSTSTDELIEHVPSLIDTGWVLWTHVTSPFADEFVYEAALSKFFKQTACDSLMSVTKIQKFLWDDNGPVNYGADERWPRTQTLKPIYEVNSAIFFADISVYRNLSNRIGRTPLLYELTAMQSFDIDWEDDFVMAEKLWKTK